MAIHRYHKSLSVVIPAYNEESCIDDGSDRTALILEHLKSSRPCLVVVRHERNYGMGRTLRLGLERCRNEITFYSDADLQIGVDYFKTKHGSSNLSSPGTIATSLREMLREYPALMKIERRR